MRTSRQVEARRWLWATTVPAVVALLLAAGLTFQLSSNQLGLARMAAGDPAAAKDAFDVSGQLGLVEDWKAPFNAGTARYGLQEWDAAAAGFERAAALAPQPEQCRVRLNWAWSLEAGADRLAAGDDPGGATARFQQAQFVLAAANCPDDPPRQPESPPGTLEEQWDETRERIQGKTGQLEPPKQEPETAPDNSQQLQERERQAQEQRQQVIDEGTRTETEGGEKTW